VTEIQALLVEHLRTGKEIWLPASGGSMWPVLADGDFLLVRGLGPTRGLRRGDIAVVRIRGSLVAHFVVGLEGETVHTRGIVPLGPPAASPLSDVLGVVVAKRSRSVWQRLTRRILRVLRQTDPG
jgi:signal peptidase I